MHEQGGQLADQGPYLLGIRSGSNLSLQDGGSARIDDGLNSVRLVGTVAGLDGEPKQFLPLAVKLRGGFLRQPGHQIEIKILLQQHRNLLR
ncbi:MAG TPA: hypothetical protein VJ576_21880 [Rhodocyclaceae bacterium]|nr:hypothetical protein [Rhodocyclaceae bacterium]